MNQYRTNEGDRLDIIVFKAYGSVDAEIMDAVLDANPNLLNSATLPANSIVYLPEIQTTQVASTSKALW